MATGDRAAKALLVFDGDFLTLSAVDVQELGARRDRRVPVSLVREEVFEVVNLLERNEAGIAAVASPFRSNC